MSRESNNGKKCISGKEINFLYPLQPLARGKAYTNMYEESGTNKVPYIELAKRADLFIVVPATANTIDEPSNGC